jgi:hypothetical protein
VEKNGIVTVYVRMGKGDNEQQRDLTFKLPDTIPAMDLLKMGIAIDGNQALISVAGHFGELDRGVYGALYGAALTKGSDSLAKALAAEELALVDYFSKKGLAVEFR